jgi:hypothetical protein
MKNHSDSFNRPESVADALGLGFISDGDDGISPDQLRAIYAHAQNLDGQRELIQGDPSFVRGWVNLEGAKARELISQFVSLDDADDPKAARKLAKTNLEAQAWNDVLGIESPPIYCKVKIRSQRKWGLRFESGEPCMRGNEKINEHLPRATAAALDSNRDPKQADPPQASDASNRLDEILKLGGLKV